MMDEHNEIMKYVLDNPYEAAVELDRLRATHKQLVDGLRGLLNECQRHGSFQEVSFEFPSVKPVFDAAYAALFAVEQK